MSKTTEKEVSHQGMCDECNAKENSHRTSEGQSYNNMNQGTMPMESK